MLVLIMTIVGFFAIGPFLALAIVVPFYPGGILDMANAMSNPVNNPEVRGVMMGAQGLTTFFAFIVFPLIYIRKVLNIDFKRVFGEVPTPAITLLVFAIVIIFMIANSLFIDWNQNVSFPSFLQGFENWARAVENQAAEVTEFLTASTKTTHFLVSLLVIAVLPAIGEELVFRGLIQDHLHAITQNKHIAVWVAAFLFSFLHMQFFGFVPRMLLGALFGYLFVWSGNLMYPIIAHFFNNGFTLFMVYWYQKGAIDFDIESTDAVPLTNVMVAMAVTAVLLYLFALHFRKRNTNGAVEDDLQE